MSMAWNLVRLEEVVATPWRNGGGVTRELLAWPSADAWRVRMSVAEVEQDGPFSRFEGVQRWFAVLAGAGVRLRVGSTTHALTRKSAPYTFDGNVQTDCGLIDGPTQDFNLMLRGGRAQMHRAHGASIQACSATDLIAVYTHGERTRATFANETLVLEPKTLAWRILQASGPLRIETQAALWMEIKR